MRKICRIIKKEENACFSLTYDETRDETRKPAVFTLHLNIDVKIITTHSPSYFSLTCSVKEFNETNIHHLVSCI